jgi:hypothetical protein
VLLTGAGAASTVLAAACLFRLHPPELLLLLPHAAANCYLQVLALQALQPLLLVSPSLSQQHSMLLEALLADPGTPAALQLQAVTAASQMVAARPAQSQGLVLQLEQLLLRGLAAAARAGLYPTPSTTAAAEHADNDLDSPQPGQQEPVIGPKQRAESAAAAAGVGAVDVLCCAAGVYAVLLLGEKLLLAPRSWKVVAAGLLAAGRAQVGYV